MCIYTYWHSRKSTGVTININHSSVVFEDPICFHLFVAMTANQHTQYPESEGAKWNSATFNFFHYTLPFKL